MNQESNDLHRYAELQQNLRRITSWKTIALASSEDTEVFPPLNPNDIADAEQRLGISFPEPLKNLYRETNGVLMNYGVSTVMPISEMVETNLSMRDLTQFGDLYMPFDHLLLVGQAGNGDMWAYRILMDGTVDESNMYAWDHESDGRPWVASGLHDLLMRVGIGMLIDAINS